MDERALGKTGLAHLWRELKAIFEPKSLVFHDTAVPETNFLEDMTYRYLPYRAAVPLAGVLESMTPQVVFSAEDAASDIFAPVAACYDGGVYIWADTIPDGVTVIPTIICKRS